MRDIYEKLLILNRLLRSTFNDWKKDVWSKDLDRPYCCSGHMCGCLGASIRDVYLSPESNCEQKP